jgi:hypothetical protein
MIAITLVMVHLLSGPRRSRGLGVCGLSPVL